MSLNGALTVAANSLSLFTSGIQVSGNNIANSSTTNYVRSTLGVTTNGTTTSGGVLIGNGATATGVTMQLDKYLESRIYSANTDASASSVKSSAWSQLQTALGDLSDSDLSSALNSFVSQLETLASTPDSIGQRTTTIQQAQALATQIQQTRTRVDSLRSTANDRVVSLVGEANQLIQQISGLNSKITTAESNGLATSDDSSLRQQRLDALNRLSEIMPIKVVEQSNGAVDVHTNGDYLILDNNVQTLKTVSSSDGQMGVTGVQLSRTKSQITSAGGGELGGTIAARDDILGGYVKDLDQLSAAIISTANQIHASGEGTAGYTAVTSTNSVKDATASLASSAAGLAFPPTHGSFVVKVVNQTTGEITQSTIQIDADGIGSDTSLNDLAAQLGGVGHITASVGADNKLTLKADNGYEIRFSNDSSGVLAGLGINTLFTGSDSSTIGVNAAVVGDPRLLATGTGGGTSDTSNLVKLAGFLDGSVSSLGNLSIDQFQQQMLAKTAQSGSAESALSTSLGSFRDSLMSQREQTSGVSLDEETINIMQLQRNYQAAARVVSVVDELMNTLLQI